MIRRITSPTVSPDAIQFPGKPIANCRLVELRVLGTDTSAGEVSNGFAHLTCDLQSARPTERAMYLGLNLGGFG